MRSIGVWLRKGWDDMRAAPLIGHATWHAYQDLVPLPFVAVKSVQN